MIVLDLPKPPTTNNLYFNVPGRGRSKTKLYRTWKHNAGWEIQIRQPGKIKGQVNIDIAVTDKARGDCANREKAVVDLLVTHGVIEGDSKRYVRSVMTRWAGDVEGVRVTVSPA